MNINQASFLNTSSGQAISRPSSSTPPENERSTTSRAFSGLKDTSNQTTVTISNATNNTILDTYSKPSSSEQTSAPSNSEDTEPNKAEQKQGAVQETQQKENEKKGNNLQLSEENLKAVQELKKRDQEVRMHEAAHLAAAGKYATGGASYDYQRGPDGKNYAVGGEVGIDTSPIPEDPQATLQKAQQIRAAAQAPTNPSSQDRQVAASATQMESKARQEISESTIENTAKEKTIESEKTEKNTPSNKAASAYQAIGDMPQKNKEAASLIEIIA